MQTNIAGRLSAPAFLAPVLALRPRSSHHISMVGTRSGGTKREPSSPSATPAEVAKPAKRARKAPSSKAKAKTKANPSDKASDDVRRFWLLKSEPESRFEKNGAGKSVDMKFGLDDLTRCVDQTEPWDGVRNHEAKNAMLGMKVGELGFFYRKFFFWCESRGMARTGSDDVFV